MNCQSFENNVIDIVRRQPMEAGVIEQSLVHAESCQRCALQLEEQRMLGAELRGLSDQMKAIKTPDRIEMELLEALRGRKFQPQRVETASRTWAGMAAIAAVLLIVFGAVAMRLRTTTTPPPTGQVNDLRPEATAGNAQQVAVIDTPILAQVDTPKPQPFHRASRIRRRPPAVQAPAPITTQVASVPEITTQFMPLGDVSVANLQDGAQVIRVEMPRYAMARFGFPVNMERYDENVKADVWMGVDGLARAIRFVQ